MEQAPVRSSSSSRRKVQKVILLPVVFLIFYEVSGGPFGIEDSVGAAGPLLAILGFIVFPFIWSIPEALITAELGTMFPENGGYVVWVTEAFGPFWGFQQGWWKWASGVIDNGLYPLLFLDSLKEAVPAISGGLIRVLAVIVITAALTCLNYIGLAIVGWLAVCLGIFSLLPFAVMSLLAVPRLRPTRWLAYNVSTVNWRPYLNTLFWNLNYWDSISTLVGEIDSPHKTLPKALLYAVILIVSGYLIPLLAATGAVDSAASNNWRDGSFASIAVAFGDPRLCLWIELSAAVSNMGMFEAEMSSDSFQLLGMAERGMLPQCFARRSQYGTPTLGILASATGVLLLATWSFQEIIAVENYLYCLGMITEFAAFLWLRWKRPDLKRPFKLPFGLAGSIIMCVPPTILILLIMASATIEVVLISFVAVVLGLVLYPCLGYAKKKKWLLFDEIVEAAIVRDDEDKIDNLLVQVGIGLMTNGPIS